MNNQDLANLIEKRFDTLEKRIDDLERYRAFVRGIYRTLSVVGAVGVLLLGLAIKYKP